MKKKIILIILFLFLGLLLLNINEKEYRENKIVVSEVTHSIFYAPWYVALSNNYFDDLNIEVVLTNGANNVIASLISNDADIGLCGAEAVIYAKDNNIKAFSALTKKDGQFIILRNNIEYNSIEDLNGLTILSGRSGGMPLLSFKDALENNNIKNVNIDSSIDFANLTSAFIGGMGEGVNLFEPNATKLVKSGYGYIADMVGNYSSTLPYTTFNTTDKFINENKDVIKKFYNGINKGLEYVNTHNEEEIADIIKEYFNDIEYDDLVSMIKNYKENDSWFKSANLKEEYFNNLEEILLKNNTITEYVNYSDIVYEVN